MVSSCLKLTRVNHVMHIGLCLVLFWLVASIRPYNKANDFDSLLTYFCNQSW